MGNIEEKIFTEKETTFVLPLKIHTHHNYDELFRFKNIQLKSFKKYLDFSALKEFIIISPHEEIEIIKSELEDVSSQFPFVFVDEDVLCPSLRHCKAGWIKQMLLKIVVANIVKTEYYLTLDSDVFLTKPICAKDFIHNGKLIFTKASTFNIHPDWWQGSCDILNFELKEVKEQPALIDVTPQFLITNVCRELQKTLQSTTKKADYLSRLIKMRTSRKNLWTEYSLYWVFLLSKKMAFHYYDPKGPGLCGSNNIWDKNQFSSNEDIQRLIKSIFEKNKNSYFALIQSNVEGLDQQYIADLINQMMI